MFNLKSAGWILIWAIIFIAISFIRNISLMIIWFVIGLIVYCFIMIFSEKNKK